jgi:hypothetical protein
MSVVLAVDWLPQPLQRIEHQGSLSWIRNPRVRENSPLHRGDPEKPLALPAGL